MSSESRRRVWALAAAAVVLIGVAVAWWRLPRLGEAPPRGANVHAAPPPDLSVVSIPVELPLAQLQASIDASIPQVFAQQRGEDIGGGMKMDLDARRAGPLSLTGSHGALNAEVPVAVTVRAYSARRADSRASKGKDAPTGATVTADLVLRAQMTFDLSRDWALLSTTHLSHRWTSKPTVAIGPLRLGIERLADKLLNDQWGPLAAQIDVRQAAADTSVRDGLQRAWTELSTPRQVGSKPPTWFVGAPETLFASSPTVDADAIRMTVGLTGRFAMVVGDPGPAPPISPLPPRSDPPAEAGFRLAVPTGLDWASLSATASTELVGTTWTSSVGTATVDAVELYPSGDRVVVAVAFDARAWKTDGILYLSGRPVVDRQARAVRVEDFDFGAGTTLGEIVKDKLVFPFGDQLDAAKARFEEGLTRTTPEGNSLHGTVGTFAIDDVRLTDEAVVVDAVVTGTLSMTIGPDRPAR